MKARFSAFIERCREGPVIVTKNGRPAAVIVAVPADPDEPERFVLANTSSFRSAPDRVATPDAAPPRPARDTSGRCPPG